MQNIKPAARVALSIVSGGKYSESSDAELIVLCQQKKDQQAFDTLVRRHQKTVNRILYQLAPDWQDAADLSQEVFIRMWRNIGNLRNPRAFTSWIKQIATHLFYDELRKRPRQLRTVSMDESAFGDDEESPTRDIPDRSGTPEELFDRADLALTVRAAMAELPEQFRTALVLRELHDLTYDEIAQRTNAEIGTVKSRIARGRAKVQERITPYLNAA